MRTGTDIKASIKFAVAVAAVLMAGSAFAQDAPPAGPGAGPGMGFGDHRPPFERSMGEHGRWWNNPQMADKLKLTDAQRKAMDDTFQQHRETLIDLRSTLEKAEVELDPLMKEDQPNESAILAQIDRVAQARAELEKANARFLLAIRGKLSPEQRKTLEAERASHPRPSWRGGERRAPMQPSGDGQAPPPSGPQSRLEAAPEFGPADFGPPPPHEGDAMLQ
jgi:Spy/CpxP family protein refolding chaperone